MNKEATPAWNLLNDMLMCSSMSTFFQLLESRGTVPCWWKRLKIPATPAWNLLYNLQCMCERWDMYSSCWWLQGPTHSLHTNTILQHIYYNYYKVFSCCFYYTYDRLENTLISVTVLPDLFLSYTPQLEYLNLNNNKITQLQTVLFGKYYYCV